MCVYRYRYRYIDIYRYVVWRVLQWTPGLVVYMVSSVDGRRSGVGEGTTEAPEELSILFFGISYFIS